MQALDLYSHVRARGINRGTVAPVAPAAAAAVDGGSRGLAEADGDKRMVVVVAAGDYQVVAGEKEGVAASTTEAIAIAAATADKTRQKPAFLNTTIPKTCIFEVL